MQALSGEDVSEDVSPDCPLNGNRERRLNVPMLYQLVPELELFLRSPFELKHLFVTLKPSILFGFYF